jgi:O-antigen/teichoic acid export membrane protein
MNNTDRASLAQNALALFVAQALSTALAMGLNAALGRTLGPAEYGRFVLASTMAGFAYVILEWGQTQYVVREIAVHSNREGSLFGTALVFRIIGVLPLAAATAGIAWELSYDAQTRHLAVGFVFAMLPFFLAQAATLVFRARERMRYEAYTIATDRLVTLGATLLMLWLGSGITAAVGGVAAGGLVSCAAAVILLRKLRASRPAASQREATAMLAGGAVIMLVNVESSIQPYFDSIILSKLAPAEVLGWYGAARSFVGTLTAPALILSAAAYPRFSRSAADHRMLRHELTTVLRPVLALAVLAFLGTLVFAQDAVDVVYGKTGFADAGTILRVMAPSLVLFFVDNTLAVAVIAIGRTAPLAIAKVLNIAVTTLLALWLVPACQARLGNGGLGLAIAAGVAEFIMLAAAVMILPKGSLAASLWLDLARAIAAGVGTLVLGLALPPLPFFVGALLCIVAFGMLSIVLGLFRVEELRSVLRSSLGRGPSIG